VDGAEQRYRDSAGPLHRWEIRLAALDEGEMAALEQFFADNQGCFGNFAFTDPWDGTRIANCSLASDELELTAVAEMQGQTSLTVVENRDSTCWHPTTRHWSFEPVSDSEAAPFTNGCESLSGRKAHKAGRSGSETHRMAVGVRGPGPTTKLPPCSNSSQPPKERSTASHSWIRPPTFFAWSDNLDNAAWAKEPFLSIAGGIADPGGRDQRMAPHRFRRRRAEHLPDLVRAGGYVYCLSVFARSAQPTVATCCTGPIAPTAPWERTGAVSF